MEPRLCQTTAEKTIPVARTSRAAEPPRVTREVSTKATDDSKPAKPGLVSRILGKINPGEQMPLPPQEDLFAAPPPATEEDSSPGKCAPDDRDPYAKPGDCE